jgi:uncharacterized protein (TIGR02266 family)
MAVRSGLEELSIKEQQAELWEEKLVQRAQALLDSSRNLAAKRTTLNQLLTQLRQSNPSAPVPAPAPELLKSDPLVSSVQTRQAREGAEVARRSAVEARLRAAQLWEEELARQTVALNALLQGVAQAQADVQQAIDAANSARVQAQVYQAQAQVAAQARAPSSEAVKLAKASNGIPMAPSPTSRPPAPAPAPPRVPPTMGAKMGSAPTAPRPAVNPSPAVQASNQRAHQRTRLKVQVDFESDHNFFTGFSSDISEGGLFVATVNIQPLGAPVEVAFALPTGEQVMARGSVKWVREANGDEQNQPGMGIQFDSLPDDAREAVHKFIVQRDPIFYDE